MGRIHLTGMQRRARLLGLGYKRLRRQLAEGRRQSDAKSIENARTRLKLIKGRILELRQRAEKMVKAKGKLGNEYNRFAQTAKKLCNGGNRTPKFVARWFTNLPIVKQVFAARCKFISKTWVESATRQAQINLGDARWALVRLRSRFGKTAWFK